MTHEELALQVKAGDKEQLGPLWEGTKRLLFSLAAKENPAIRGSLGCGSTRRAEV